MEPQQSFDGPQVSASDSTSGGNPLDGYFANGPAEEVIADLKVRATNQWNSLNARGVPTLWRLIYAQAFGMDPNTSRNSTQRLEFCGAQAQFVRFRINMTRSHIKQRNQLAQGQRPSFRTVALNDNSSTLAQIPITGKAFTYVFRESGGEAACYEALESDGYFGEGSIWQRWDADAGDVETVTEQVPATDQFTGQPLMDPSGGGGQPLMKTQTTKKRAGAPTYTCLFPWNVIRDQHTRKPSWIEAREKASKYELMARYPDKAELLKGLTLTRDGEPGSIEMFLWDFGSVTDDVVIVKHWYHRNCAAVPGGRYIGYVGDVVLWNEPCPLANGLPITPICSARYFDTPIGYPESSDLLSIQEMIDELLSQWASNVLKFGNQNMWGSDGVEFDPVKFAQGGSYFTLKEGQEPPKVIDFNPVPEGTRYLLEYLPARMSEIDGMNSVVRGAPEANITSGVFASLMQSIAEKFIGATQAAYDFALNEVGNNTLDLIRSNASTKFLVRVSGDSNLPYMKYFTAGDFEGVHSVYVERQSPVMNSIGGRFEVFDKVINLPPPLRRAAVHMLKTGDDETFTEADESATILIRAENEMMMRGQPAMVSKTDDPKMHAPEHRTALDRLRTQGPPKDPQEFQLWNAAIMAFVRHIDEHAVTWAQTDPVFAAVLGLPIPPQMMPGMGFVPHPTTTDPKPPPGQLPPKATGGANATAQSMPGQPAAAPGLPATPGQQTKKPAAANGGGSKPANDNGSSEAP